MRTQATANDDGRIKPDLVANGQTLVAPTSWYPTWYANQSGTSFSAPGVTGSLGLLMELHQQLHGTNSPLLASTMKGLVIHTADEAGAAPGPDYSFGWGLMNTLLAARVLTNNAAWNSHPYIKEVALNDGDYIEFDILATTNAPLKITLCWTDPPGALQPDQLDPTNLVLVNDIDLRVITPDGTITNMPWTLDPLNPSNAATTGDNIRDNVEQVLVDQPTNGWYTIRVRHKGTLSNDVQDVSIVVTGNTPTNAPDFVITDVGGPAAQRPDPDPVAHGGTRASALAELLADPEVRKQVGSDWPRHAMPVAGFRYVLLVPFMSVTSKASAR